MTTLRLTVSSAPPDSSLSGQHMDIGVTGATLGRAASNQCVLPDNERIVSSKHASIAHELGEYVITDHSTNGTFINDSPSPLGPNNSAPLKEGDSVAMGKYLFTVKLVAEQAVAPPAPGAVDSFLDDLGTPPAAATPAQEQAPAAADATGMDDLDRWLEPDSAPAPAEQRWGASNVVQADAGIEEENDPLAAIDQARRSDDPLGGSFLDEAPAEEDPDWWKGSQNDNVDPLQQAFEAPRQPPLQPQAPDFAAEPTPVPENLDSGSGAPAFAAPEVPAVEDADALDALLGLDSSPAAEQPVVDGSAFDMPAVPADAPVTPDDLSSGIVAEHTEPPAMPEPETPPEPTPTPPPVQAQATAAQGGTGDVASVLAQLLELGTLDQNQLDALTPEVVSVLQVTISHLLELLRARSSIKNELRLDRTMIQPVENNPLKFALTEKDALRYLFGEHSGAYMSGSKAVKEAFNDVSDHQMALLAGMRSAYEKMLGKFSPEALEARFGEAATKGLLSSKKARLWDAYVEYFDKLQQDPETSFNRLFGEEFASAYETQVDDIKFSKSDR